MRIDEAGEHREARTVHERGVVWNQGLSARSGRDVARATHDNDRVGHRCAAAAVDERGADDGHEIRRSGRIHDIDLG